MREILVAPSEVMTLEPGSVILAPRAIVGGRERSVSVRIESGRIAAIDPWDAEHRGTAAAAPGDAGVHRLGDDEVLLPGLVDTHVHVNEPGRTEWEGFETATRAAAAGGVTTIIDMPLNSIPPTTNVAGLQAKREAAAGQCLVDVGFWGGAVPGNLADLAPLHAAGVFGFKCFLLHSGVEEFPPLDPAQLRSALTEAARVDALVIVHAEDAGTIEAATPPAGRRHADFLASRPRAAEELAIAAVIDAARATGARVHILHLADGDALPLLRAARAEGIRISVETCPHYLTLDAEDVPDGATEFKCCPPIREHDNRDELWAGLADGTIATVVTDHSPCPVDLKTVHDGDFGQAWGGIAGLQVGLSAVWTEARARGYALADVVRWMATGPADQVGLTDRGRIEVGATADFAILAPDESFVVDPAALHHRHPVSAYAGRRLGGVVRRTVLRGIPIDPAAPARGTFLRRGQS